MSLARAVRSHFIRSFANEQKMLRARHKAAARRQAGNGPIEVLYFHQVDDPYSQLAAQALERFTTRYDVKLMPRVVAGASAVAIHDQSLWKSWARRECALIAAELGMEYRDNGNEPDAALIDLARRILLAQEPSPRFADIAIAVSQALREENLQALKALAKLQGEVTPGKAQAVLRRNEELRHDLGHYLGAMFYCEGEWYWGIDRLHYLEERLDQLGAHREGAPSGHTPAQRAVTAAVGSTSRPQKLEFFASLRSPYTHLSYDRIAALCARYPIELVVRPVIPMMMRGVKADRRKGKYIIFDTAREARRLGVPFGNVWDPFGKPVLRAYSLFPWARDEGRGFEYLHAYSQAVWAERTNAWSLGGLQKIVERAGLNWPEAQQRLDNTLWVPEIEGNADAMIAAGSWGVPSFRLAADGDRPELTVWGQDRIWLLEAELARRCDQSIRSTAGMPQVPSSAAGLGQ